MAAPNFKLISKDQLLTMNSAILNNSNLLSNQLGFVKNYSSLENGNKEIDCNRFFLEEFEDLNDSCQENHKLSYTQQISQKKGFYQQKVYDFDNLKKKDEEKRKLLTKTIADSSRIQTQKFFQRENIKQQMLKERDYKLKEMRTYRKKSLKNFEHSPFNKNLTYIMQKIKLQNESMLQFNTQNSLTNSPQKSPNPSSNLKMYQQLRIRSKTQNKNHSYHIRDFNNNSSLMNTNQLQNIPEQEQEQFNDNKTFDQLEDEPVIQISNNQTSRLSEVKHRRPPTLETPKKFIFPNSDNQSKQITMRQKFNLASNQDKIHYSLSSAQSAANNHYSEFNTKSHLPSGIIPLSTSQQSKIAVPANHQLFSNLQFQQMQSKLNQSAILPQNNYTNDSMEQPFQQDLLDQLAILENSKNFYKKQMQMLASSKMNNSTNRSSVRKYKNHYRQMSNYTPINIIYNQSILNPIKKQKQNNNDYSLTNNNTADTLKARLRSSTDRESKQRITISPKTQCGPRGQIEIQSMPRAQVCTTTNKANRIKRNGFDLEGANSKHSRAISMANNFKIQMQQQNQQQNEEFMQTVEQNPNLTNFNIQ
ncbi:UNKNOWN [Stylonychia lemnae]|uniref:Uncharacterized protein n=1 Tax=Stylonychia lemnae TaxID=5949 RepID=A0A078AV20_STYLE|nr:UNKNOWN [Stylonychia lemnae]|eukprot:CDW86240.1 UNKNOWN [Stylonychia lemnae]